MKMRAGCNSFEAHASIGDPPCSFLELQFVYAISGLQLKLDAPGFWTDVLRAMCSCCAWL
jgi:hypothetical protein